MRAAFAPKLAAARKLADGLKAYPINAAMGFSSAAALLGAPGQANYAAANAALDGFVCEQATQGLPFLSVQWGAWGAGNDESAGGDQVPRCSTKMRQSLEH